MSLFKIQGGTLSKIESIQKLEKELQALIETNLLEALGIHFIASEFTTSFGGRIDTLGIDLNGSPVIIEYKRGSNNSVINQALSYLKWLLDHKEKFENLVSGKPSLTSKINLNTGTIETNAVRNVAKIDWDSPRVICIAESYNRFDLDTADFLPLNIELIKYRIYDNNTLLLDAENYQKVNVCTSRLFKNDDKKDRTPKLQKEYTLEDLFKESWKQSRELFNQLRERILALDENIVEKFNKLYVTYKLENNFCEVVPQAGKLHIHLDIPLGKLVTNSLHVEDVSKKGHWATGNIKFYIRDTKDLDPAMYLIKQSYNYIL